MRRSSASSTEGLKNALTAELPKYRPARNAPACRYLAWLPNWFFPQGSRRDTSAIPDEVESALQGVKTRHID